MQLPARIGDAHKIESVSKMRPVWRLNGDGKPEAVFEVPIPGRHPVFMRWIYHRGISEQRAVVLANADRFIPLWINRPGRPQSESERRLRDHKYEKACAGFSYGPTDPVELALAFVKPARRTSKAWFGLRNTTEVFQGIELGNGITRTTWLLNSNCSVFPISCEVEAASTLAELIGEPALAVISAKDCLI